MTTQAMGFMVFYFLPPLTSPMIFTNADLNLLASFMLSGASAENAADD